MRKGEFLHGEGVLRGEQKDEILVHKKLIPVDSEPSSARNDALLYNEKSAPENMISSRKSG